MQDTPPLFTKTSPSKTGYQPLAFAQRPKTLETFIGQSHLMTRTSPLRKLIEQGLHTSLVLWGPPGTGKTTLAHLIASKSKAHCICMNAVSSQLKDIKEAIATSHHHSHTIVFIDELHRFNKLQQEALLPSVESGQIQLIGTTTENPYFYVVSGLISRCHIHHLTPHSPEELKQILIQTLTDLEHPPKLGDEAMDYLCNLANGDARKCLSILEQCLQATDSSTCITPAMITKLTQQADHARTTNDHYALISAYIKSLRGSDPDAALYWMVRLLKEGETPEFILRRMIIFASEDIGNADPQALSIATSGLDAARFVGQPESHIILSHITTYLALAPKSNASYTALQKANAYLKKTPSEPVPSHLKTPYDPNHTTTYKYPHDYPYAITKQDYWSNAETFYTPKPIGYEKTHIQRQTYIRTQH